MDHPLPEEDQKDPAPGLLPSVKFVKKVVGYSILVWAVVIGVYLLLHFRTGADQAKKMGNMFGGEQGPQTGSPQKKQNELNDFDVESHILLGSQALDAGDPEQALLHFERASVMVQGNANLAEKIGDALFLVRRFVDADQYYTEAEEGGKPNARLQAKSGLALFFQDRTEDGIAKIQASVALDSGCGECFSALARALSGVSPEREGAARAFYHSMMLAPQNPDVAYYYAKYLMDHRQHDEAISVLKNLTDRFPLYAKGHGRLGMTYYYLGRNREAVREYEIALRINPRDYNTWYNLGEIYYTIYNDSTQALSCYQKTIENNEQHSQAHFRIGLILFRNREYKEASSHFDQALQNDPNNTNILMQLAAAYEKLELKPEAAMVYEKILQITPLNRIASYKLSLISGKP